MSNKTKNEAGNKSSSLDSVDQIRNILFGEQIVLIEKRFAELETNLTKTISALSDKVDKANKELEVQIDKSNKQLSSDSSSLANQQSDDMKKLESEINNKLIDTESELLNQIQTGLEKLDNKASHRNELAILLKEMADKLSD